MNHQSLPSANPVNESGSALTIQTNPLKSLSSLPYQERFSGFREALDHHFPGTISMRKYVHSSKVSLEPFGFFKHNSLACISICRDEITKPFMAMIQKNWDNVFSFSGLAGMLCMGKTGFLSAYHHAPVCDSLRRQIFFVFTHIGLGPEGEFGQCYRRLRNIVSPACGALLAFQQEIAQGIATPYSFDPLDPEQSLIRQKLMLSEDRFATPDLVTLTKRAHGQIIKDLEHMITALINPSETNYAVFSGIQIHGPDQRCYIWPGYTYATLNGECYNLPSISGVQKFPTFPSIGLS